MVVLSVAVPGQRRIAAFITIVGGGQAGRAGAATAPECTAITYPATAGRSNSLGVPVT